MENKKLLNFLLKDLSELDELFDEKEDGTFDELEMEFLQTRLKGSKKLVQILFDRENQSMPKVKIEPDVEKVEEEKIQHEIIKEETKPVVEDKVPDVKIHEGKEPEEKQEVGLVKDEVIEEVQEKAQKEDEYLEQKEMELEEEQADENQNKTLGDSFLKGKSVNDILAGDLGKLEHKLSNRPVENIQAAIGINDQFQYIRELFEGSGDDFNKTVMEIDKLKDLQEAVNYLQQNFKWKKNETSLKFVNLVKRRFSHE